MSKLHATDLVPSQSANEISVTNVLPEIANDALNSSISNAFTELEKACRANGKAVSSVKSKLYFNIHTAN